MSLPELEPDSRFRHLQSKTLFHRCLVVHHSAGRTGDEVHKLNNKETKQLSQNSSGCVAKRSTSAGTDPLPLRSLQSETLFHRCFVVHHSVFQWNPRFGWQ
jgi:hypothetical protein